MTKGKELVKGVGETTILAKVFRSPDDNIGISLSRTDLFILLNALDQAQDICTYGITYDACNKVLRVIYA